MRPWYPPEPAGPGCPDGFASLSACPRSAIGSLPGAAPFPPGYAVAYPPVPAPFSPGPPSASLEPSAAPPRQSRSSPWNRLRTAGPDRASERGRAPRAPRAAPAVAAEPARLPGPPLRPPPARDSGSHRGAGSDRGPGAGATGAAGGSGGCGATGATPWAAATAAASKQPIEISVHVRIVISIFLTVSGGWRARPALPRAGRSHPDR